MNSLKVPEGALRLTDPGSESNLPPQAFHVQLDKSTIESIIQASRSGEDLRLSLGSTPVSPGPPLPLPTRCPYKGVAHWGNFMY